MTKVLWKTSSDEEQSEKIGTNYKPTKPDSKNSARREVMDDIALVFRRLSLFCSTCQERGQLESQVRKHRQEQRRCFSTKSRGGKATETTQRQTGQGAD